MVGGSQCHSADVVCWWGRASSSPAQHEGSAVANGQSCTSTLTGSTGHCRLGWATSPWARLPGPGSAGGRGSCLVLERGGPTAAPGAGRAGVVGAGGECSWPGEGAELLLLCVLHRFTEGTPQWYCGSGTVSTGPQGLGSLAGTESKANPSTPAPKRSLPPYFGPTAEAQL